MAKRIKLIKHLQLGRRKNKPVLQHLNKGLLSLIFFYRHYAHTSLPLSLFMWFKMLRKHVTTYHENTLYYVSYDVILRTWKEDFVDTLSHNLYTVLTFTNHDLIGINSIE